MAISAKPFQNATIDVAVAALTREGGSRRFLVADEVGLGKTIVARGIIERLSRDRETPLRVFYVCSNLGIIRQNLKRLVGFLPEEEQALAISEVDRPSLMPIGKPPSHPRLRVFSLTPGSALPNHRGMARTGRMQERALACALIETDVSSGILGLRGILRHETKRERFTATLKELKAGLRSNQTCTNRFRSLFLEELENAFPRRPRTSLEERLIVEIRERPGPGFVAKLRGILALAALREISPDVVILDEFQRFADILDDRAADSENDDPLDGSDGTPAYDPSARVLQLIKGSGSEGGPRLLLLSATPYTPYRSRGEAQSNDAAEDFFSLVKFLYASRGAEISGRARDLFSEMERQLRDGEVGSSAWRASRDELQVLLREVMARTERSRGQDHFETVMTERVSDASLEPADLEPFVEMRRHFSPDHHGWLVPFWHSIPLPMQSLDSRYKAWTQASTPERPGGHALTERARRKLERLTTLPHPRLRALTQMLPTRRLALPWVAPSIPWWQLGGAWTGGGGIDGKVLLFSQFRASPKAIAGLLSYSVEADLLENIRWRGGADYERVMKRSVLRINERPELLELFHPSPLLTAIDPLLHRADTIDGVKESIAGELRRRLHELGIDVAEESVSRPPWRLLAAIEGRAGTWSESSELWRSLEWTTRTGDEGAMPRQLGQILAQWSDASREVIKSISHAELKSLAVLVLGSPAVVLARAVNRHWPDAVQRTRPGPRLPSNMSEVLSAIWHGLRFYLDAPWFAALFATDEVNRYHETLTTAVFEGNLESVLDEHFWFVSQSHNSSWQEILRELTHTLRLRASTLSFHESGPNSEVFRLRSHVAAALIEGRRREPLPGKDDGDAPWRPEEVRNAFNSPFWPNVLATTSIGQEGLDFHPWCRTIAHWDLCPGPVALEQREGRILRYASLAVRRALASKLASDVLASAAPFVSPWSRLAGEADRVSSLQDERGLSPWWTAPGAEASRIILSIPGSEQRERLKRLNRERVLYRLVLGMPNQADLLDLLTNKHELTSETIRAECIDLSPM